jgi:hypothetical protein
VSTTLAAGASQYTTSAITTAGFAVGLALLAAELWRWYKGGGGKGAKGKGGDDGGGAARNPKALIPLALGIVCGILMVACPAGLLGLTSGFLRWGGNGAGGLAMDWLTGQKAAPLGTAATPTLDGYGAVIVTALTLSLWLLRKSIAKAVKGKWKKGVLIGVLLCISTGTAAMVAQTVVGSTNDLGRFVFGQLATGTFV